MRPPRRAPRQWFRRAAALLTVFAVPATAVIGALPSAATSDHPLRVYVLVTDGLDPDEVSAETMPNLAALRDEGAWFEQARSVFVAETLPNHVAMATGVLPSRNGIVANSAFDPRRPADGDVELSNPSMLTADTTVTRLERTCPQISTATIVSKTYLYDIFAASSRNTEADLHWNAEPLYIPGSEHALDQLTMERLRRWVFVEQPPAPQYAFVNLGDIDRSGHLDPTGGATGGEYPAGRRGAMLDTDTLIGEFVAGLKRQGWWDESVLFVASDHGMDFSAPGNYVDLQAALEADGLRVGFDPSSDDVGISENGGAALVYVHRPALRSRVRDVLSDLAGVDRVLTRAADYARYGLDHPRAGTMVVLVDEGFRVASGDLGSSNPLPGNHGHSVTQHSVLLVAGGHEAVRAGVSVAGPAVYRPERAPRPPHTGPGNLSIAPTVADLFGAGAPSGGFDGPRLDAALTAAADTGACPATAVGNGSDGRNGSTDSPSDGQAGAPRTDGPGGATAAADDARLPATGGGAGAGILALLLGVSALVRLGSRRRSSS